MGSTDWWRNRFQRAAGSWHTHRMPTAIGARLVVGLIGLSALVAGCGATDPGSRHLRVTREVSGTINVVNFNGAKFCLDIDVTGEQFCSESYQRVGSAPLVVGEHVTGTVALLSTGPSSAVDVFILTNPLPTP